MGFFDAMLKAAETHYGKEGVYVASEVEKRQRGVNLPFLMLQRLFGLNVIPLSKIVEFAGPPGSCKSAMAFLMARIFMQAGGYASVIETENKFGKDLCKSILTTPLYEKLFLFDGCVSSEIWQEKMSFMLKKYAESYDKRESEIAEWHKSKKKDKGPRPRSEGPLLLILDSLGGVLAEATQKNLDKEGHAAKTFPVSSLLNSQFFTDLPRRILGYPVTVLYTNHEMIDFAAIERGEDGTKSKGGNTPSFFACHRFFFEKCTEPRKEGDEWVQTLAVRCFKNSFNQKASRMRFDMRWFKNPGEDGDEHQVTWFDFDSPLTRFLAPAKGDFQYDRMAVKEFLTVTFSSLTKYSCKELRMEDVGPSELGKAIETAPDTRRRLSPYLGIKQWPVYGAQEDEDAKKDPGELRGDDGEAEGAGSRAKPKAVRAAGAQAFDADL